MANRMNSVFLVSLGCSKNLVDSEVMLGSIQEHDYIIVDRPEDAQIIIVNTCGFIRDAQEESVNTIIEMADYKNPENGCCKKLVVAGCLSQRYVLELMKEMPEVDLFVGTGEYHRIVELMETDDEKNKNHVSIPRFIHSEKDLRVITTPYYSSWLKIGEGCDRHCSFCIIPKLRGRYRSRTVDSLLMEATKLVKGGVKELNLISQDLSVYGSDLGDNDSLIKLLSGLEKIDGLEWIRLMYFYPDELNEDLIAKMSRSSKICHYLDMPIQHFSDRILKRMNRRITGGEISEKIKMMREMIPEVIIRTSVIVGFPGEAEEDFNILLDGIKKARFDNLGVFRYSDEEGTAAEKMSDKVDEGIIEQRYRKIHEAQKTIVEEINRDMIGKNIKVIIEGLHEETELLVRGRHKGQAPEIDGEVIINDLNGKQVKKGDLVSVQVSDYHEYDLVGHITDT